MIQLAISRTSCVLSSCCLTIESVSASRLWTLKPAEHDTVSTMAKQVTDYSDGKAGAAWVPSRVQHLALLPDSQSQSIPQIA